MSATARAGLALLILSASAAASAVTPIQITHSGRLLEGNDDPVNGFHDLSFRLYDAPADGESVWQGDCSGVNVTDGHYAVVLGGPACPGVATDGADAVLDSGDLPFGDKRWLEISFAGTVLSPRLALNTLPNAATAGRALTADSALLLGVHPPSDFVLKSELELADVAVSGSWNDLKDRPPVAGPQTAGLLSAEDWNVFSAKLAEESDPKVGRLQPEGWCREKDGKVVCETQTPLPPTGVTPGVYKNATVTVDAQGRVTAILANTPGDLFASENLADLTDASAARTNLGLGNVATRNTGVGAGQIPLLDGNGRLPALDGRNLTNLPVPSVLPAGYTSAETTISAASPMVFNHGLGGVPRLVVVELVCKTAELGWSVGDRITMQTWSGGASGEYPFSVVYNATNVTVVTASNGIRMNNRTNGAPADLNRSRWRIVVRAWR